ncbi:MAG: hypothetical protein GY787_02525 [Alteromonadales bacterium]|nr:hypothetical protein [Alteromonadales bacterium]
MFILNKHAANALVANYKMSHAIKIIQRIIELEVTVVEQQRQLEVMKDIVWEVINGQSWIGQEQALKMSGVKHPRLFMKYLKGNTKFYEDVTTNREYLSARQCNQHGDRWFKFSREGFQWLLDSKSKINGWVEEQKVIAKNKNKLPC